MQTQQYDFVWLLSLCGKGKSETIISSFINLKNILTKKIIIHKRKKKEDSYEKQNKKTNKLLSTYDYFMCAMSNVVYRTNFERKTYFNIKYKFQKVKKT